MNKKLGVFAVLAIFIIGIVPVAFADDSAATTGRGGTDAVAVASGTNVSAGVAGVQVTARPTLRQDIAGDLRAVKEKVLQLRVTKEEVRADIATSRAQLNEARLGLLKDKDQLAAVCTGNVTSDCQDMRSKVKLEAEQTLMTSADHIIAVLNEIKTRAQASDTLSADVKATIATNVDADIAKIQAARDKVAALDDNSSAADVKAAAAAVGDAWKDIRATIQVHIGQLAYGELKAVTDAVTRMSDRLQETITTLKDKGADVSAVEALKTQFDAKIADAKTHLDNAEAAYAAITPDNAVEKGKVVNDEMHAARDSLQQAHDILKDIALKLRTSLKEQRQAAITEKHENKTVAIHSTESVTTAPAPANAS
jgi:hypothetical protein